MTTLDAINVIEGLDDESHDDEEYIAAFQVLVNSGLVWKLQGFYGRTAARMLAAGLLTPKPEA